MTDPRWRDAAPHNTLIRFSWIGPATAPDAHTEYIVEITGGRAAARVGGYGTVKGDGTARPGTTSTIVSETEWNTMTDRLADLPAQADGADGCVGGSTYSVTVTVSGRTIVDRSYYACGPAGAAAAAGYRAVLEPLAIRLGLPDR
ncbi:hypothetical protein [Gordonia shandongensis]|uniref:hypothetical protein n=1 Tax=Gordonia shandongensis TaxID=376351 RepID=UPI0004114FCD|nr:hypothetical protein [Gordonia shandongensis]